MARDPELPGRLLTTERDALIPLLRSRPDGGAGPVIAGAGHVREVFGEPGAYEGAGLPDAPALLARATRERGHLPLHADLDDLDEPTRPGDTAGDRTPARYIGDAATLVRLYSGRPVEGRPYELSGAEAKELNIFG
ncbi:hypothetical protein [Streptomyces sviceus]|uniref:hypothetical protein n=1 Tax=Streptomyces sviceus TaxID=285530 RepID=UPI003674EB67